MQKDESQTTKLGEIVKDCDTLNLEVGPTTLPAQEQYAEQTGLFSKTTFTPGQMICQARGSLLSREHLPKLLLEESDVLIGTYSDLLIHCNSICKHANDIIVRPKTIDDYRKLNLKSLQPFRVIPGKRYNSRFVMKNGTEDKVFIEATATINKGQEIFVKHDIDVWLQKFKCIFTSSEEHETATEMAKLSVDKE